MRHPHPHRRRQRKPRQPHRHRQLHHARNHTPPRRGGSRPRPGRPRRVGRNKPTHHIPRKHKPPQRLRAVHTQAHGISTRLAALRVGQRGRIIPHRQPQPRARRIHFAAHPGQKPGGLRVIGAGLVHRGARSLHPATRAAKSTGQRLGNPRLRAASSRQSPRPRAGRCRRIHRVAQQRVTGMVGIQRHRLARPGEQPVIRRRHRKSTKPVVKHPRRINRLHRSPRGGRLTGRQLRGDTGKAADQPATRGQERTFHRHVIARRQHIHQRAAQRRGAGDGHLRSPRGRHHNPQCAAGKLHKTPRNFQRGTHNSGLEGAGI